MTELYQKLYLKKHTPLNLQLNERYFSLALKAKIFTTKALKKDKQVDAFVCWYSNGGLMTASLLGYDTDLPSELGLYRQAFAIVMTEASDLGMPLHMSGGAGSFKILRGGAPCVEYDAVYARHLPYSRHLGWYCVWAGGMFQHAQVWRWTRQGLTARRK
jgi:hypothetical protein